MNAPNLSRRLATRIIEGLQGRGRIIVVRGGTSALIRTVDDVIAALLPKICSPFELQSFARTDDATRDNLTLLAANIAEALFSSEHLEDLFADRSVIEREAFDAAIITFEEAAAAERAHLVPVELDLLGYVASTAGKLASEEELLAAFERAANSLGVKLSTYDAAKRQASFVPDDAICPDVRLEIEEAVADELASLVSLGVVSLPVIERIRPLVHQVDPAHHARLLRVIERVAIKTLRRAGCSARWELPDDRSIRIIFTPLSEQDARDVDTHFAEFAAEVDTILGDVGAPLVMDIIAHERSNNALRYASSPLAVEEVEAAPPSEQEPANSGKRTPRVASRPKSTPRSAPKGTVAIKTAKRGEPAVPEKKSGTRTRATAKRATTKKARVAKKG